MPIVVGWCSCCTWLIVSHRSLAADVRHDGMRVSCALGIFEGSLTTPVVNAFAEAEIHACCSGQAHTRHALLYRLATRYGTISDDHQCATHYMKQGIEQLRQQADRSLTIAPHPTQETSSDRVVREPKRLCNKLCLMLFSALRCVCFLVVDQASACDAVRERWLDALANTSLPSQPLGADRRSRRCALVLSSTVWAHA